MRRDAKLALFDAIYFLCADRIAREVAYQTIIVGELGEPSPRNFAAAINGWAAKFDGIDPRPIRRRKCRSRNRGLPPTSARGEPLVYRDGLL